MSIRPHSSSLKRKLSDTRTHTQEAFYNLPPGDNDDLKNAFVCIPDLSNMARKPGNPIQQRRPDQERRPVPVNDLPHIGIVRPAGRIQISQTTVIVIISLLVLGSASCVWKYLDYCQAEKEQKLQQELTLQEMQHEHEREKEQMKIDAELKLKEKTSNEERKYAHEEELHRINTVSAREADPEKYKMDIEKEKAMLETTLAKEMEVEKEQLLVNKSLREKELEHDNEQQLRRIELLSEKELEFDLEKERLRIEQELEEEKIKATKEIYMKSFEAKKVVKKKSYLFGIYSTEREEVESPLQDAKTVLAFQEAMRPRLTQRNETKAERNDDIDEDL